MAENRRHLAGIIGAVDARVPVKSGETQVTFFTAAELPVKADSPLVRAYFGAAGRCCPAFMAKESCSHSTQKPEATVIAIPDADQTPEMLAGLVPGIPPEAQFARRLAESGCRVIIPMLIDRADTYSIGARGLRPTNEPHREFIYRQAFEMGRHLIGYEVQKVLALVDHGAPANGDGRRHAQACR